MSTPVAVITGASSGIGEALAKVYAAKGFQTVLLARRLDRTQALAATLSPAGLALEVDVTREADLQKACATILEKFGRIDTVIANAGFGVVGSVEKLTVADYQKQFDTNVYGVLRTFYAFVGALKQSKGKFAIIGSVNGYISLGGGSPYAMSKFAVRALADSLWYEMRPQGVSVTHIGPGFVKSEIRSVNNRGEHRADHRDPIPAWLSMDTMKAARQIGSAIERRKRERIITGHGKALVFIQKHFTFLMNFLIGRLNVAARSEVH
ncbi:MAG: SDR family NAD(P)-dependent oxidoreductase [Bdellovibrionota bacterium]